MAGSYPDVPGNRIPYDIDGTKLFYWDTGSYINELSGSTLASLNNEDTSGIGVSPGTGLIFLFPRAINLSGHFWAASLNAEYTTVQYSTDTTTGIDGTWTGVTSGGVGSVSPAYRTSITSDSLSNIVGWRFYKWGGNSGYGVWCWHFYGDYVTTTGDRLDLWHPTLDQRLTGAYFDWGNTSRNSTEDRTFRVKNISETLTADDVTVSLQSPTVTNPTFDGMHTVSFNAGPFAATANIGIMSPDTISNALTLRRTMPSNASLGPWAMRIRADTTTWS